MLFDGAQPEQRRRGCCFLESKEFHHPEKYAEINLARIKTKTREGVWFPLNILNYTCFEYLCWVFVEKAAGPLQNGTNTWLIAGSLLDNVLEKSSNYSFQVWKSPFECPECVTLRDSQWYMKTGSAMRGGVLLIQAEFSPEAPCSCRLALTALEVSWHPPPPVTYPAFTF